MKEIILEKLHEIETENNVKILHAVESGSRAWGFPSPDSDYDVRFIYVRPTVDYLRLNEIRDVIELPIDEVLDINGWDLKKTLRLLYTSNPTLFEWFSSKKVYLETDFAENFRPLFHDYFLSQKGLYHYLSMAKRNYREYLKSEQVRAKKYFYVLRPILACKWILEYDSPPPILFEDLVVSQLDPSLKSTVDTLLELKTQSSEIQLVPKIKEINDYIESSFDEIEPKIRFLSPKKNPGWGILDDFFLQYVD